MAPTKHLGTGSRRGVASVIATVLQDKDGHRIAWRYDTMRSGGGAVILDAATITNPTTQITDASRQILKRGPQTDGTYASNEGSLLIVRLGYDDGLLGITDPVIKVFGRKDSTEARTLLRTKTGALNATLTTAPTDVTDGTLNYTTPDLDRLGWDVQGCREILIGIETKARVHNSGHSARQLDPASEDPLGRPLVTERGA